MNKVQVRKNGSGLLTLITGCMFAGKSTELIIQLDRLKYAGHRFQLFKPANDQRYSNDMVVTHDQRRLEAEAVPIENPVLIITLLKDRTTVVGIDEAQFFLDGIVSVVSEFLRLGIDVIVAGLKLDSKNQPFGHVPELVVMADILIPVYAVCTECGGVATRTQWLGDANAKNSQVVVGGSTMYSARCPLHHVPK